MSFTDWLSSEWKQAWKWLSVQLGAVTFIAPTLYENVSIIQDYVSPKSFHIIEAGLGILVMLNAVKKKGKR